MRLFISLLLTVLFTEFSYSKAVDITSASSLASSFIANNSDSPKRSSIELALYKTYKNKELISSFAPQNLFYIFNFSNDQGFIIIAADDRIDPVLGYSSSNDFDIAKAPALVLSWIENYKKQITNILAYSDEVAHPAWVEYEKSMNYRKRGITAVAPLLKTTWSQDANYYELCPKDPVTGKLSVTGCVATAMAQTLKYWNYPSSGRGQNTYTPPGGFGQLQVDFSKSIYNYVNMPAKPTTSSTGIPLLMRDCGYAVNMQYSSNGSGAEVTGRTFASAEKALVTNFGYSNSITSKERRFFSNMDWINLLKAEFAASRVVIYYGYNGNTQNGHCFLADGYDANNLIHINWGWAGSCDGYFNVSNLSPSTGYNYATNDGALFGIQPASCNDGIAIPNEVCVGSTLTAYAPQTGGTWATSDESIVSIGKDGIIQAVNTGNVTLTYILPEATTCTNKMITKSISVVKRLDRPSFIIGDTGICQLETKQYALPNTLPGYWSNKDAKLIVSVDGRVQGITSGKALLTYNFGNACYQNFDTISKWINVKVTPVVPIIKGVDSLCVNTSITYTNTLTGGVWSVLDVNTSVTTSGLLKGLMSGYTTLVYAKNGTNGCVGVASKKIKIKAVPNVSVLGPDSLCQNTTALYTASLANGTWAVTNANVSTTNGNTLAKTPGVSGVKYTVTVNGCSSTASKDIYVKALPATGTITGAVSFCGQVSSVYTSSVKGGVWSISNNPVFSVDQNGTVISNNISNSSGILTYTTKAKNCSNSTTITISVVALPAVTITGNDILTLKQQLTYKASVTGGVWSVLDKNISVTSAGVVTGLAVSTIPSGLKYVLTGKGVCAGKTSSTIKKITVSLFAPLLSTFKSTLKVYPNPSSGIINLNSDHAITKVVLMDMLGKTLQENLMEEPIVSIDYSHFQIGNYLLMVTYEDGSSSSHTLVLKD